MMNEKSEPTMYAVQTMAVQQSVEEAYLSSLLSPASETEDQGDVSTPESLRDEPASVTEVVQQAAATKPEKSTPASSSAEIRNPPAVPDTVKTDYQLSWPQVPFACQLISVAGLKLALPLSSYTQALPWPAEIVPANNTQVRLIGHMEYGNSALDIVDLAGLILNRTTAESVNNGEHAHSSVLLLQDGNTCLPCDEVSDMVTVDPEKVCWRSPASQRIWLAGTVKDQGYVLLDVDGIMKLLNNN